MFPAFYVFHNGMLFCVKLQDWTHSATGKCRKEIKIKMFSMETIRVDTLHMKYWSREWWEESEQTSHFLAPIFCPVQAVFSIPLSPFHCCPSDEPSSSFIHSFSSLPLLIPYWVYRMPGTVLDARHLAVTKKIGTLLWRCLQSRAALPKRASWGAGNVFCTTANSSRSHVATELLKCGLCIREVLVGEIVGNNEQIHWRILENEKRYKNSTA